MGYKPVSCLCKMYPTRRRARRAMPCVRTPHPSRQSRDTFPRRGRHRGGASCALREDASSVTASRDTFPRWGRQRTPSGEGIGAARTLPCVKTPHPSRQSRDTFPRRGRHRGGTDFALREDASSVTASRDTFPHRGRHRTPSGEGIGTEKAKNPPPVGNCPTGGGSLYMGEFQRF